MNPYWMLIHHPANPTTNDTLPGDIEGAPLEAFNFPRSIQMGPPLEDQVETEGIDDIALNNTIHLVQVSPLGDYDIDGNGATTCDDGWRIEQVDDKTLFFGPNGAEVVWLCRLLRDNADLAQELGYAEADHIDTLDPLANRALDALQRAGADRNWMECALSDIQQYSQLALLAADLISNEDAEALRQPLNDTLSAHSMAVSN